MKLILFTLLIGLSASSYALTMEQLPECVSVDGIKIPHYEKAAREGGLRKRILVIGQIHGDEPESGELADLWINRLDKLNPSNHWRIIPLLNPDGTVKKTRYNAHGVDLNRNFPTKDWEADAINQWKTTQKSNVRRHPGPSAGSEPETKCVITQIEAFKPDIIISIHTPYGLFDFDGPHKTIKTGLLPWRRLGTFTGSLGRYMWDERKVPVLTIELKQNSLKSHREAFIVLQDKLSDLLE